MNDPKLTSKHEAAVEEAEEHENELGPTYAPDMPVLSVEQPLNFDQESR